MTGVDVSSAVSTSTASCFKSSGVNLIIPRAFHSTGTIDTAACTTLNNAKSGMSLLLLLLLVWSGLVFFVFALFSSSLEVSARLFCILLGL
jgi:hypothetical protein